MGSLASYVSNMIRRLAALHYQSLLPRDARLFVLALKARPQSMLFC